MTTPIPESGQLVEVRQRHFVVTDVRASSIPTNLSSESLAPSQHLITLSSVEDDALGEEIKVLWEIEPGAKIYDRLSLPNPTEFDSPEILHAFLDAVRWGAVSSADIKSLQSPFRSGIEIQDYQLDAVVRALQMPRVNLLIADDVGLGKTIEAGLVVQELILRHRIRTILVICPASLQIQWKEEMRDKFGLEFRIVDSELMKELRRKRGIHANPWTHFPRLITSIDYLKRERPLRLLREVLPAEGESKFPRRFDLMIIDEAHNVAPAGSGYYAKDSLRTDAVRTLSPNYEHKLFLTATPHNGYPESFSALLELLDDQRFARGVPPDLQQLHAVMVRRMKSELKKNWDGTSRFPERVLDFLEVDYTEQEKQTHKALHEYTISRLERAATGSEAFASEFVLKLLKKRMFSSPMAFALTLEKHEKSLVRSTQRLISSSRSLERKLDEAEEDYANDEQYEEQSAEAVTEATRILTPLSARERELLDILHKYAADASKRADTKAHVMIDWLKKTIKPNGKWSDTRVIIFTEYRATQKWLQGLLAAEGLTEDERLETFYGGMDSEERERIKAAFQSNPAQSKVRILIATDAASEGINLQNHCSNLIHYEIPWNPNRMEQRNGRLDRHGQRAPEVHIYHFVGKGFQAQSITETTKPGMLEGDLEFLMRAALKINTIREDLGKVGPVIASQVEDAMLGRRKTLDTATAEKEAEPVRKMLRFERDLRARVEKLHTQLQESKIELNISPENIKRVVDIGLKFAGHPPLREVHLHDHRVNGGTIAAYHLPPMAGSWSQCHEGLRHPHTQEVRPVVFDNALTEGRDDIVLAHLNHRLVQMCLRLLRAEIWSSAERKQLNRVCGQIVPNNILDTVAVIGYGRLVVLGGDSQRLHEEVIIAGGFLREGHFARMNVGETTKILADATNEDIPEQMKKKLLQMWPSHSSALLQSLDARMKERTTNLHSFLNERAEKEIQDITAILKELERSIQEELKTPVSEQLELWSLIEKDQFERNMSSIRARLASIPAEIVRETDAIKKRYSNPVPRIFPVAITYLVPERIALEARGK